jgi:hypothetical protein
MNADSVSGKLEALRRRKLVLETAIATEKIKQQKRKEKERERLEVIIGKVLLDQAALTPDSDLMLRQILKTADMDERSRKFLAEMGWR